MQNREQVQRELVQLLEKQIDTLAKEAFGGLSNAELREYEERQKRIDTLYAQLYYPSAA
jgi:hypothetical protein